MHHQIADRIQRYAAHREKSVNLALFQKRRGIEDINRRFDEVDTALDNVLAMLEDIEMTTGDLQRRRDWLYRTNHAWTPMFTEWANAPNHFDEFLWKAVERSYQFLAPRYMPYKEWSLSLSDFKSKTPQIQVW